MYNMSSSNGCHINLLYMSYSMTTYYPILVNNNNNITSSIVNL